LNEIRRNPTKIVPHLENMLTRFNGNILERPSGINLRTQEGPNVVHETIDYLKQLKVDPAQPDLTWSDEIWKAARDHVKDHGPKSMIGHTGSDGSSVQQRIQRYCQIL